MSRFSPIKSSPPPENSPENSAVIFSPPPPPDADFLARQRAARAQRKRLAEERDKLFIEIYGQPAAEPVTVPLGSMVVTLSLKFDNSDSMTDYFDRHASLSPDFALLVLKKQNETEKLARRALALVPDLSNLDWEWHTEKYSMGHGNYLESSGFELPAALQNLQTQYRGGNVTHGHWEIEFTRPYTTGNDLQILPHKNFGREIGQTADSPAPPVAAVSGAITLSENHAKNGIQIHFPSKPDEAVRAEMKAAGWRWSFHNSCWYHRNTPENKQWADAFIARHQVSPVVVAPPPISVPAIAPVAPPSNIIPLPVPVRSVAPFIPAWRRRITV